MKVNIDSLDLQIINIDENVGVDSFKLDDKLALNSLDESTLTLNIKYAAEAIGSVLGIHYTSQDTYINASIYIVPPAYSTLETSAISTVSRIGISGIINTPSPKYTQLSSNFRTPTFTPQGSKI